jgi:hypothetical protein
MAAFTNKGIVYAASQFPAFLLCGKPSSSRGVAVAFATFNSKFEAAMARYCWILVCVFVVSGCATQPISNSYDPPGFFLGIAHGFLALPSLIGSFFWDIRVYSFPNSGRWYDVGFIVGTAFFFGGIGRQSFEQPYLLGYDAGVKAAKAERKISN